jgi:3-hydroxyisobutyrate dehydrogenase-like beta-hydroxyacid dehydrogenase
MMKPRVAFLGLGMMGGPMARRLAQSGFRVSGYDINPERTDDAAKDRVHVAKCPAMAVEAADVVMSSLPKPAAIREAYLGADGAVSALRAGAILVDMSTIDPNTWREVADAAAARGADSLGAPVSGGPAEAGSGRLVFLVGGEATVIDRCRPVLETLGSEIHHLGPLGAGHIVKLVNNVMSMCNVAVAAEAMVLGVKAGMDPQRLFEVLSTSGGRSHHFLKRFPNVLAGDFTPHFSIALSRKDLSLALQMAEGLGVPMLATSAVRQIYEAAAAQGLDTLDMAAVTTLYEQWAGVKVRARKPESPRGLKRRPLR